MTPMQDEIHGILTESMDNSYRLAFKHAIDCLDIIIRNLDDPSVAALNPKDLLMILRASYVHMAEQDEPPPKGD